MRREAFESTHAIILRRAVYAPMMPLAADCRLHDAAAAAMRDSAPARPPRQQLASRRVPPPMPLTGRNMTSAMQLTAPISLNSRCYAATTIIALAFAELKMPI